MIRDSLWNYIDSSIIYPLYSGFKCNKAKSLDSCALISVGLEIDYSFSTNIY